MELHIANQDVAALAFRQAAQTGLPVEEVVWRALKAQEPSIPPPTEAESGLDQSLYDDLMAIAARCAALPAYDDRTPEEIIGYDENGLPT